MKDTPVKVLMIEDHRDIAFLLKEMLTKEKSSSFTVEYAYSLKEGFERLDNGNIDVVLLDLGLPDSQGIGTFEKLSEHTKDVPIMVLTGQEDQKLAFQAVQQGAQDYLFKGEVDSKVLVRSIRYAIERHRMVVELERHVRRLKESESRFHTMIEKNVDGIVIVDKQGVVLFVNPAAEDLLGRTLEELIGELFGFPLVSGEKTELEIFRKEGGTTAVDMRMVETEWEGRSVYLASLRDITDRKRMLLELKQTQQQQLELKDQFLSNVSHELRSPLTAIHQFITIMLDGLAGDISSEQRDYLEIVLRNLKQLRTMIDDLLEVTRAETVSLTIELRPISVGELITETVDTLHATASSQEIVLSSEVPDELSPVFADPDRVRQIIINLVNNAIKFTPEKGTITIHAQPYEKDPRFLCISVTDTGCGISPEDKERIFEYLYQVENTVELSRKGLGLGLYICKELVSHHGGQIWVESQPGQGSTFFFTLPFFSLTDLLTPIFTPKNLLKGSIAFVTVEMLPAEERFLTKTDERALRGSFNLLKSCVLPDLDVLLPRIGRTKKGEIFFLVASADQQGTEVLTSRIKEQLTSCEEIKNAGLDPMVSFAMVDIPSRVDEKPREQLVKEMADSIETLVNKSLYKRRNYK